MQLWGDIYGILPCNYPNSLTFHNLVRDKIGIFTGERSVGSIQHAFFRDAQADIRIPDRFGEMVNPQQWFFLSLDAIKQATQLIKNNEITDYRYDAETAQLVRRERERE